MQLTLAERIQLRNQLKIMKALKLPDLSPHEYDEHIAILEGGYEIFYPDLLSGLNEAGIDADVTAEVLEILSLFRALDTAAKSGLNVTSGRYPAKFAGFDGNNDPHYGFSHFVLDVQGKFTESAPAKNSHTASSLGIYRDMVETWQSQGRKFPLSQTDVDAILK
jgi:uncharacterized protein YfbU (UPF0304 family)